MFAVSIFHYGRHAHRGQTNALMCPERDIQGGAPAAMLPSRNAKIGSSNAIAMLCKCQRCLIKYLSTCPSSRHCVSHKHVRGIFLVI